MVLGRPAPERVSSAVILVVMILGAGLWPHTSRAADAWSVTGPACMPLVGSGGALDNIAHGSNTYGAYVTFASGGDQEVFLWCPVWLPQGTYVDTIKVRAYNQVSSDELVRASFYAQPSISTGGSSTLLGYVDAASSATDANVTSAGFTRIKICNYNDGTTDCNADTKVMTYFVLVRMKRANYTPKLYSVWIGDPPVDSVDMQCQACPMDCGDVIQASEAGARLGAEEQFCLPPRSWEFGWP